MQSNGPVQLRFKGRHILQEGRVREGSTLWISDMKHAENYVRSGIADVVAPTNAQRAGPAETKPAEASEKKSFAVETGGPSTGSAPSNESATAAPPSASPEAPASQKRSARKSRRGGTPESGGE